MSKFIYSSGQLDLAGKQITENEDNHWFSDRFFTKYSFPVELELSDELNAALGNVRDHNAAGVNAYIEGFYTRMGEEHEAVLVLDRLGVTCSFTIRYGFEELPNWSKKLAALPLQQVDISNTNIRAHAQTILDSSYPSVNYNFPQIHINSLDLASDQWQYFEERINARDSGVFLVNEYDSVADEQINRTIIQPLPHLHHVVKAGFEDLGFTVSGSFFNDPAFAKAYIFHFSEFYKSFNGETQEMVSRRTDHNGTRYVAPNGQSTNDYNFVVQSQILPPGVYLVSGTVDSFGDQDYHRFQLGSQVLDRGTGFFGYALKNHYIDFVLRILPGGDNILYCYAAQANYIDAFGTVEYDAIWYDVSISQIAKYDVNGNLVSTLIDATTIDLKKCVPDITFGDLMTVLKQTIGLDVILEGAHFTLDLIKNQINTNEVIDLSGYEVRYPLRDFKEGDSYTISFKEQNSEDYSQQQLKIDRTGVQSISESLESNTVQATDINLVPLPLKNISSRLTAVQVGQGLDTLYLTKYNGLINGQNLAIDTGLKLLDLYDVYLFEIYDHLINGQSYEWTFKASQNIVKKITPRSRVRAYNKIFVVDKLQTTDLGSDVYQVRLNLIAIL
jgi:hypothetical protein